MIRTPSQRAGLNLNVGCASYEINGFVSIDYFSEKYYRSGNFNRVHYDMRSDSLPFEDNTVDSIYCSHVVEHIETEFVEKFFHESLRVLKSEGVLRVVCPDPEYLYYQWKNHPEYFSWHPLYQSPKDAELCFVSEVGGAKSLLPNYGLSKDISSYEYNYLLEQLRSGLHFNPESPGSHINNWDFSRLKDLALDAGFKSVSRSRNQGSYHETFRGRDMDLTHPEMSLYVDFKAR